MPRVLVLSSFVAQGSVGLKATVPPLSHAGCEVMSIPTVVLSNHPAHAHVAVSAVEPEAVTRMIGALEANGLLDDLAALITGYMPSAAHVTVAAETILKLKRGRKPPLVVCDPVLGDDPKGLYIPVAAADATKNQLVPLADVMTPNRFELAWLTGLPVNSKDEAVAAAQSLGVRVTAATSIPAGRDLISTLVISGPATHSAKVAKHPSVPHGTGDLFTGLFTAELVAERSIESALKSAVATLDRVIAASRGAGDLNLSEFYSGSPSAT